MFGQLSMCAFPVLNTQNEINVYRWQSPLFTGPVFVNSYLTCFLPAFGKRECSCFSPLTASWLESHSSFITKRSDVSQKEGIYSSHSEHCHLRSISHSVFAIPASGAGLGLQGLTPLSGFWLSWCWIRKQKCHFFETLGFLLFSPNQRHILWKDSLLFWQPQMWRQWLA